MQRPTKRPDYKLNRFLSKALEANFELELHHARLEQIRGESFVPIRSDGLVSPVLQFKLEENSPHGLSISVFRSIHSPEGGGLTYEYRDLIRRTLWQAVQS